MLHINVGGDFLHLKMHFLNFTLDRIQQMWYTITKTSYRTC